VQRMVQGQHVHCRCQADMPSLRHNAGEEQIGPRIHAQPVEVMLTNPGGVKPQSDLHLIMRCSPISMWGMVAYSIDLRHKIFHACEQRLGSQCALADLFGVRLSSVEKLLRRHRTPGTMAPKPHAGGQTPPWTPPPTQRSKRPCAPPKRARGRCSRRRLRRLWWPSATRMPGTGSNLAAIPYTNVQIALVYYCQP
jgi:hypothetical protein